MRISLALAAGLAATLLFGAQAGASPVVVQHSGWWAPIPRIVFVPSRYRPSLPPVRLGHPFSPQFYRDLYGPRRFYGDSYRHYSWRMNGRPYTHDTPYFDDSAASQIQDEPLQLQLEWVPPAPQQEFLTGTWAYYQNMGHWQSRMVPTAPPPIQRDRRSSY